MALELLPDMVLDFLSHTRLQLESPWLTISVNWEIFLNSLRLSLIMFKMGLTIAPTSYLVRK